MHNNTKKIFVYCLFELNIILFIIKVSCQGTDPEESGHYKEVVHSFLYATMLMCLLKSTIISIK